MIFNTNVGRELARLTDHSMWSESKVPEKYIQVFKILFYNPAALDRLKATKQLLELNIPQYKVELLITWYEYSPEYLFTLLMYLSQGINEEQSWSIAMDI